MQIRSSEDQALIDRAEALARRLHADQVDQAGMPYTGHLARTVGHLLGRFPDAAAHEIAAAWLHDSVEDNKISLDGLALEKISPEAIKVIALLSRSKVTSYLDYVRNIASSGNTSAIRVKLSDNADNSDPERLLALGDRENSLQQRYAHAREILERALCPAESQ